MGNLVLKSIAFWIQDSLGSSLLTYLSASYIIYKIDLIIAPASWGHCEISEVCTPSSGTLPGVWHVLGEHLLLFSIYCWLQCHHHHCVLSSTTMVCSYVEAETEHFQVQLSSVAQSCPALCNPMNCSTPGLPVHHQLRESTQTHVHCVGDAFSGRKTVKLHKMNMLLQQDTKNILLA